MVIVGSIPDMPRRRVPTLFAMTTPIAPASWALLTLT